MDSCMQGSRLLDWRTLRVSAAHCSEINVALSRVLKLGRCSPVWVLRSEVVNPQAYTHHDMECSVALIQSHLAKFTWVLYKLGLEIFQVRTALMVGPD